MWPIKSGDMLSRAYYCTTPGVDHKSDSIYLLGGTVRSDSNICTPREDDTSMCIIQVRFSL